MKLLHQNLFQHTQHPAYSEALVAVVERCMANDSVGSNLGPIHVIVVWQACTIQCYRIIVASTYNSKEILGGQAICAKEWALQADLEEIMCETVRVKCWPCGISAKENCRQNMEPVSEIC